jgi:hypothetical protein
MASAERRWRAGRLALASRLALRDLLRRPLVVVLLVALPALFQAVVVVTTATRRVDVMVAVLHEDEAVEDDDNPLFVDLFDDGRRDLDQRALSLVFLGVAAVGLLSAFVAFYVVHGRVSADRRLVLAGFSPGELAVSKLLLLASLIALLSLYEAGLVAWLADVRRPGWLYLAFVSAGLVYGSLGLALGALVRHELQGILAIVLLANIDIGWLQNPAYYADSSGRWLIESLPGFFPAQLAVVAALTKSAVGGVAARAAAIAIGAAVVALVAIAWRVRLAGQPSELVRRLAVIALAYLAWTVSFEAVGFYARTLDTLDPTLALDRWIPFCPGWVWIYELTYLLPFAAAFAIDDPHRFNRAVLAIGLASVSAYAVYLTLPVAFAWPPLGDSLAERVLAMERAYDFPPGANHLPSLHVANALLLFAAVRGQRLGKRGDRAALGLTLAIAASTLLVKKHLVVDVVAGMAWGPAAWAAVAVLYPRLTDRSAPPAVALAQALSPARWRHLLGRRLGVDLVSVRGTRVS